MDSFSERLASQKPMVLDGATGTEINRRGITTELPLWSAGALKTHPDVVREIHQDYINAGADIVTTNTFRTHKRNLGSMESAKQLTSLAVKLALEAASTCNRIAYVAGSVAPLEDCYSPHLVPDYATCYEEHHAMVTNLVESGVHLCLIETMNTIHEAEAAARAARSLNIPYVVSFVLDDDHNLLSGQPLSHAVAAISPHQPDAIMVNCIPTHQINSALRHLRAMTPLPIGSYDNMGTIDDVEGWHANEIDLEAYQISATEWLNQGVRIVGSCCGSTPQHTAVLRKLVDHFYQN